MHRPSLVNEWQIPPVAVLPTYPALAEVLPPLDEHETSYLAPSVSTLTFSSKSIPYPEYVLHI